MKRIVATLLIVLTLMTALPVVASAAIVLPFTYHCSDAQITEVSTEANTNTLTFTFTADTEQASVFLKAKAGKKIEVFADSAKTCPVPLNTLGLLTVHMDQKTTVLYLRATANQVSEEYQLIFVSPRKYVDYQDEINISAWSLPYLSYCNENGLGIIYGDENGNALPLNNMTRYEIAAVAARFLGLDCSKFTAETSPFSDTLVQWAKPSVCALTQLGIISGHKHGNAYYYKGQNNVTRQEVAIIMVKMLQLAAGETDAAKAQYAAEKETFEKKLATFADQQRIASWARPYMALAVAKYRFMSGAKESGKLYLNPTKPITREEMTAMVAREMGFDIDPLLEELLQNVKDKMSASDKVPAALKAPLQSAYNTANTAKSSSSAGKKNNAYSKLYHIYDLISHPRLVYLSPSNQMANAYTGPNTNEGAQMQAVAALLKPMLEEMGFSVFIADVKTPLDQRAVEAKKMKADVYVAIHSNATGIKNSGSWQGSIIFHSDNIGSQRLAASVDKYLSALTPTVDKGIVNDSKAELPYKEIRLPEMANILAEVEYHDYAPYANWIINNKPKLAKAFASGILKYFLWY